MSPNQKNNDMNFDIEKDLKKAFPKMPESFGQRMQQTLEQLPPRRRVVDKKSPGRTIIRITGVVAAAAVVVVLVLAAPRLMKQLGIASREESAPQDAQTEAALDSAAPSALPEALAEAPEEKSETKSGYENAESTEPAVSTAPAASGADDGVSSDGPWSDAEAAEGPFAPDENTGAADQSGGSVETVEGAEQAANNAVELQYLYHNAFVNGVVPDVSDWIEENSSTSEFFAALQKAEGKPSGVKKVERGDYAVQSVQRRGEDIYMDITVRTKLDGQWVSDSLRLKFSGTPGGHLISAYTFLNPTNTAKP